MWASLRLYLIIVGLAALRATPLVAQSSAHPCREHTQRALNECAWQKYRAADAEMQRVYRTIAAADSSRGSTLRAAQDAWLRFRDAQCAYVGAAYEGGSLEPLQHGACLEALTRARTKQLRELAKW